MGKSLPLSSGTRSVRSGAHTRNHVPSSLAESLVEPSELVVEEMIMTPRTSSVRGSRRSFWCSGYRLVEYYSLTQIKV